MGLFGGSVDEAVQGVVDAYLDYFDDYFENQGVQVQQAAKEADPAEEAPKLAAIPKDVPLARVSLRRYPTEISTEMGIRKILEKYGFFELNKNPQGSFVNDLVDNNDGTVTDKATGLMWQKSGSLERLDKRGANNYVKQLYSKRFAGYSDWRMPTIEELASLLARSRNKDFHIASVFTSRQTSCWSADKCSVQFEVDYSGHWIINFKQGQILKAFFIKPEVPQSRRTTYAKNETNYVKAVRTVK
jgi:hypothetical protein